MGVGAAAAAGRVVVVVVVAVVTSSEPKTLTGTLRNPKPQNGMLAEKPKALKGHATESHEAA